MGGHVKRLAGLRQAAAKQTQTAPALICALCARPLGQTVEWHHPLPKSRGGTTTVPIHPICHRMIHATISNKELATSYADPAALRAQDNIKRFLAWIADKPPDFDARTRRQQR